MVPSFHELLILLFETDILFSCGNVMVQQPFIAARFMKGIAFTPSFLLFIFFLVSCQSKKRQITRSCYYWSSNDYINDSKKAFLKQHAISKVYAKLMDVDWKQVAGTYPIAAADIEWLDQDLNRNDSLHVGIVPVVFITNKTFLRIGREDIPLLAKRVARRCFPAYDSTDRAYEKDNMVYYLRERPAGARTTPQEVQFDCDWTPASSANYFYFLRVFKSLLPDSAIRVSATVRLHQYKYPKKTGIPPVDRGMLMVYNINDLRQHSSINSIFDYNKAKAYFIAQDYPLPLDVVLPAYSWCIVFRNKEFFQIKYSIPEETLRSAAFLTPVRENFYRVNQDTVFQDLFLRTGDEIKLEKIDGQTLLDAATLSAKALNSDSCSIALFELSSPEIEKYQYETVEKAYAAGR